MATKQSSILKDEIAEVFYFCPEKIRKKIIKLREVILEVASNTEEVVNFKKP